jgi:hypothetical protein
LEEAEISPARPEVRLGLREVFVDYYCDGGHIMSVVEFAGEGPRAYDLTATPAEVEAAVTRLRRTFDRSQFRPGIDPENPWTADLTFVQEIGRKLMPFLQDIRKADVVCFFPHGALHNFPFHVVESAAANPLIADTAVAYGFSRRVLTCMRRNAGGQPPRPTRALVVGMPSARERTPEMFYGDGAFLRALGLTVVDLEGPERATVRNVLRSLGTCDLLHLNCHGLFSVGQPLDSALLLSDGREGVQSADTTDPRERKKYLTARKLFEQQYSRVDTVVMRACSSGVTSVRVGDEQEGLLRALIHMGAAACIVTRWKINLRSSREILRAMYVRWLQEGLPRAIALQKAQQYMLDHQEVTAYHHPYHWAPFILVGNWY